MSGHCRGQNGPATAIYSLESTKRILRSLITSQQNTMTLAQLANDFQMSEDCPIPYVALGFPNLRTFLAAMPDAFVCHEMRDGTVVVYTIESERSQHISQLVRTQKKSQTRNNIHKQQPQPQHSHRQQSSYNHGNHRRPPNNYSQQPHHRRPNAAVVQQHHQPKFVAPTQYRPPQPLPSYANPPRQHQQNVGLIPIPPPLTMLAQSIQHHLNPHNHPLQAWLPNASMVRLNTPNAAFEHPAWHAQRLQHQRQHTMMQQANISRITFQNNVASKLSPAADRSTIVQNLVRPAVEPPRNLPPAEVIPLISDSDNDDVEDVPQRQPDCVASPAAFVAKPIVTPSSAVAAVADADVTNSATTRAGSVAGPFVTPSSTLSAVAEAFAKSLKVVGNADANSCVKPQSKQNNLVQRPLDSPKGALSSITSSSGSSTSLKPATTQTAAVRTEPSEPALPDLRDDNPLFFSDLPDTVAKCGDDVPVGQWPTELRPNTTIRVFVTEVNNPTKFWFHLQSDGHPLDRLMNRIENFYDGPTTDPIAMRVNNVIPGLLCAARFMGLWHRARIVERLEGGKKARVFFFDYGTTDVVLLSELRYLLRTFAELPAQAYRGALDGLRPTEHRWTRESCYTFLELVADVMLYGSVTHVDAVNRIVRLVLVNTTRSETVDVVIHRVLLQRQLALPSTLDVVVGQPVRHFSEMYPTFEMLETGVFPSFREVGHMMVKGINCDAVLYENFAALCIRRRQRPTATAASASTGSVRNGARDGVDNVRMKRPPPIRLHRTNPFAMDVLLANQNNDWDAYELCE